jgi:glucokinase
MTVEPDEWVLIDIDGKDVRFATVRAGDQALKTVTAYQTSDFTTAIDCVNHFSRDKGISLFGRRCFITISGAVTGDTIRVVRCRWIISISGLGYIFGSRPIVMNDSTAKAWSNLGTGMSLSALRSIGGVGMPMFEKTGKWTSINFSDGLGTAAIQNAPSTGIQALDGEGGHMGFVPETDIERRLATELAKRAPRISWETALQVQSDDPLWPAIGVKDSQSVTNARAAMLGAFSGDVTLAHAGWSGVFLHGQAARILTVDAAIAAFTRRFEDKGFYGANQKTTPRWIVTLDMPNLRGAAQCIAHTQKA